MDISFIDSIHIEQFSVRIKLAGDATLPFYHCNIIYGILKDALHRHPLGQELIIEPVESSRVVYSREDYYNFGVTLLKKDDEFMGQLQRGLNGLAVKNSSNSTATLLFDEAEIIKLPAPCLLPPDKNNTRQVSLRFITPLRMEKGSGKKYDYFDHEFFDPGRFLFLLYNRLYDLSKLSGQPAAPYLKPEIPECKISCKNLMWIDVPATDKKLGGIIGKLFITGQFGKDWLRILHLGQYLHAGNNSSFGLGKYIIENEQNPVIQIKKEKTFLQMAIERQHLSAAFQKIKLNSNSAGTDGITTEEFAAGLDKNIADLIQQVENNDFKAAGLAGFFIEKKEGQKRGLAIPTVKDRLLQRAIADVITPSIEKLLEENSYAFRKGVSRKTAANKIESLHKEGYNFLLKADIESFFENVNWEVLSDKLNALFYNDPVTAVIQMFIKQPVIYNGVKFTRSMGLPQGSPLSPLLANLYLDEFDESLKIDYKLVRYADDFVILCKSKEELLKAKLKIEDELHSLKLELKNTKTTETSFDEGFDFLGYHFINNLYSENSKSKKSEY